ncbi:MAG: ATP-binding protein [Patescibacteria group bacterium]
MDRLDELRSQVRLHLLAMVVIQNIIAILIIGGLLASTNLGITESALITLSLSSIAALIGVNIVSSRVVEPMRALWQTVLHLSPAEHGATAPTFDEVRMGRELVISLVNQIYQLINISNQAEAEMELLSGDLHHNFIAQNLPLPMVMLDETETIRFANPAAAAYVGLTVEEMVGKNVYMVIDMSFPSEETFDKWLKTSKVKSATAVSSWERVRLNVRDDHPTRLFDLAAYYNRNNPEHNETMLVLFDHTKEYSQDDQAVSFIALSVHELRTPLTLLRGYIEVFEDELGKNIDDPELKGFMMKMNAQAEQLTAFVNNILNVARVDNDQLELKLHSEDWSTTLKSSIEMLSLRAKVRDISLKCSFAKDLPPVAIDKLSIREVVNNLVDNAIKYSGTSKTIEIKTFLNPEGLVETTVQDFGLGISSSILPNLFSKFYRDHRNRAQIGGTGLGLYLAKAIVTAHGGTITVKSHEGQGSTFGFTLLPYDKLGKNQKPNDFEITRGAHGWIKNHSLYRR